MILIADIKQAVADEYGLPVAAMSEPAPTGKRGVNSWNKSHPRQVAMCLSYRLTNHGLTRIGHFFGGRDRKTVFHAWKAVDKRRDERELQVMRRVTLAMVRR